MQVLKFERINETTPLGKINIFIQPLIRGIEASQGAFSERNTLEVIDYIIGQFSIVLYRMRPTTEVQLITKKRIENIFVNLNVFKRNLASNKRDIQIIGLFQQLIQAFAKLTLDYVENILDEGNINDSLLRARIASIRKTV